MGEHGRDLEGADDSHARHFRRLRAGDVPALPGDGSPGRLEKLGEQVEAGGLAGPVRADQRMDRAASDTERDVLHGDEAAKLLRQPRRFENDLAGQPSLPLHREAASQRPGALRKRSRQCPAARWRSRSRPASPRPVEGVVAPFAAPPASRSGPRGEFGRAATAVAASPCARRAAACWPRHRLGTGASRARNGLPPRQEIPGDAAGTAQALTIASTV